MLDKGMMIGNRYEILGQIGTGGMSDVYGAKDHSLDREVAIKVLKEEFVGDTQFVTKFKAEAQSAAGLEHPNIVNIYDVGNENGLYYIVMEKVEGITLKTYISKKGQLSYNEVISIAIQVGRGIEAAHKKNIVHRDIKPQNIMISKEGKVKVTDFGIAKAASSTTLSADPMGSVHYSSPEQVRGGFANFQSDIYSLGIVMFEMCTGRVPFDGDTAVSVAIQHLQSEMPTPVKYAPNLPISVEKIIKKCTMKSPDRRYQTIGDLLVDLKKALVTPDEDFVNIVEAGGESDKTKVISDAELAAIRQTDPTPAKEEPLPKIADPEEDDDDEDDEGPINPKMDRAFNIMGIAAAVVILGILIYIGGSLLGVFKFGSGSDTEQVSQQVEVPKLLGMTESEARKLVEDRGLVFQNAGEESSEEYEEGQVCAQSPTNDKTVAEGTTVKVMISTGKGEINIPDVTGQEESVAEQMLTDNGFEVNKQFEFSDTVQRGIVISQSPEGNQMGKSGETVTITISQGQDEVSVPDVRDQTQANAKSTLESAGFAVSIKEDYSDTIAEGNVISQSPDSKARKGSTVTITVSKGAKMVYYSFSRELEPKDDLETVYTLEDADGNEIAEWTVSSTKTVSKAKITTPTGTLYYDNGDDNGSIAVTFTKQ